MANPPPAPNGLDEPLELRSGAEVDMRPALLRARNPSRAPSVDRSDALAALHGEISGAAARRLIAIWRSADAGGNTEVHLSNESWRGFSRPSTSL